MNYFISINWFIFFVYFLLGYLSFLLVICSCSLFNPDINVINNNVINNNVINPDINVINIVSPTLLLAF